MDNKMLEKLKQDLKEAVDRKDTKKIEEIRMILNISDEQAKYFEKGLTGYPSIDKVWLKYYKAGAEDRAINIPINKTIWDVVEEKLLEYYDIPAIEYFGKQISREKFRDLCYTWARTFRALGVGENEVVPIYGPFVPDICAMVFALNMIGACPYFLKLAITKEALEEETRDAKIAVVYDGMWQNVASEFSKNKFKNIIVATVTADMPSPKKEIVSFLSKMQAKKCKSHIPNEKKYIWSDKAKQIADYNSQDVKVSFKENRSAFITSSSGTTIGGAVKGTVATNETALSQIYMAKSSGAQFYPGDRCLCHFPPAASTSLNVLFIVPLYSGETIIVDPRVSDKDFYNQLTKLKPNAACSTGCAWEVFFNKVLFEMNKGKKFDFSYAKGWTIGGEGTDVKKIKKWNEIMERANAKHHLYLGYGLSELFSSATASIEGLNPKSSKIIMDVGIPYAATNISVFDDEGNELSYNQRGNLRVRSNSILKEYYKKPELTAETKTDGWIKTGDLGEVDEDGFIYVLGRDKDSIKLDNGNKLYLFDVENKIKENEFIDDVVVLPIPTDGDKKTLVAHVVFSGLADDKQLYIKTINEKLKSFLPNDVEIIAYAEHNTMLPYSPTTLKKDKNKMSKQTTGYEQIINGQMNKIEFILNEDGKYSQKCAIIIEDKVKSLRK